MLILDDETPRARIEHRCSCCGRTIAPGERYHRQRIIGDYPYVYRCCEHCYKVFSHIVAVDPESVDDDYGIDIGEYMGQYMRDSLLFKQFCQQWRGIAVADVVLPVTEGGDR